MHDMVWLCYDTVKVRYMMAWYGIWYGTVYGMVRYGNDMAWYGMVRYGNDMAWYGMVWYGTVW